ncbi:MAG TPA: flagellar basal body rod protein FlgB [Anaerolineales bacterium]|nr:flagellar basal body rod protein FlgB [Anaerolineales bacterium]HNO30749.1 flagellar basal body rod protein FlgB [Anaerolineales bacterium]
MTDSLFSDVSMVTAQAALNGLSRRQQAISRNIANIDTPGYQAVTVDFQGTLDRLVGNETGELPLKLTNEAHLATAESENFFQTELRPGGSFRADQNNVDIDTEMADMTEAGIQYQALSQSVSQKLLLLKSLAK